MRMKRLIPFVYSSTISYLIELGDRYLRAYYEDSLVCSIETPYLESQIFELQFRQIADIMRITHPKHHPKKLSRTSATTFTIDDIPFITGPFLTRNDLIDPNNANPSQMKCTATQVGSAGVLSATAGVFREGHVGALFKLEHPRTTTTSKGTLTGSSTGTICAALDCKGVCLFNTHGSWTGTIVLERNENNGSWETFRTYISGSPPDRNVQLSWTEKSDNVQYRARMTSHSSGTINADISVESVTRSGIVKITGYGSTQSAICEVLVELESTDYTKKWYEGAWSEYRGYPSTIEFFEDRCDYAGGISNSERNEAEIPGYPFLQDNPE